MNLTNKTIRLTVKLDTLEKGTVTYQDFQEFPKIGETLKNVQFKNENNQPMGKNGILLEITKVEEYWFGEWRSPNQKLTKCGLALFGNSWKSSLAEALNVDPRRITHWLDGTRPVPEGVWADIKQLAEQRKQQIDELIAKL